MFYGTFCANQNCDLRADRFMCQNCASVRYCSESCELVHRGAHWKECRGKPGWVWRCLDKNPATDKLTATVDIPRGTKVCYFDYQWRLDDRAWHQSYKLLNGKTSILDSAKYFKAFKLDYSPISHLIEYRMDLDPGKSLVGMIKHSDKDVGISRFVLDGLESMFDTPFLPKNLSEIDGRWITEFYESYVDASTRMRTLELNKKDMWFYTTRDLHNGETLFAPLSKQTWVHRAMAMPTHPLVRFLLYVHLYDFQTSCGDEHFNPMRFDEYEDKTIQNFLVSLCGFPIEQVTKPEVFLSKLFTGQFETTDNGVVPFEGSNRLPNNVNMNPFRLSNLPNYRDLRALETDFIAQIDKWSKESIGSGGRRLRPGDYIYDDLLARALKFIDFMCPPRLRLQSKKFRTPEEISRLFQCDNFAFGTDESSRSVRAAYSDELNRVFDQVYLPVDCIPGTPTYTNMFKCMNNAAILYNRNQPCQANITPTTTSRSEREIAEQIFHGNERRYVELKEETVCSIQWFKTSTANETSAPCSNGFQQSITSFKNNYEAPTFKKDFGYDLSPLPMNNQSLCHKMISYDQQLIQEAKLRQRIEEALQEIEIEAINTTNDRVIDNQVNSAGFESQANSGYSENSLNGLRSSSPKLVNSFDWLFPSSLWSPVNGWDFDHAPWNGFNIMLSSLFGDQLNLFNVVDNDTADDLLGSWFSKCDFM